MFGQPSFGGFGGQSQPAFGSTPASSPFGGSTAFGAQPSPFGASTSTGVFGASQPAFGAAATTPAFGAAQSQGGMFGSTGFGAKPATGGFAFGGSSTTPSPFGASQPAFGAPSSAPAFGGFGASTPAFGAASSAPAFGAPASTPAFGGFGSSTPAFGAPAAAPAFGGTPAAPAAFGAAPAAGGFGAPAAAAQQQNMGSRVTPYQKHQDKDTSSSSAAPTTVYYSSITAMPAYVSKSVEELRWEDYQAGVKNASSAPTPTATAGAFGAPAAAAPAAGGFGFGSSSPAFGASSPSPFGASSAPAFGAPSPSPFGGTGFGSTPASTPAFGGFGAAASTPATGTGLFGAAASQPAASTGGFSFGGAASTPAFGATSSTPAFGAASTPSLFGGSTFGASTGGGLFGASTTPSFGASSAASPFGGSSTPAFGTPSSSPFGASTPATGTTGFGAPSSGFAFGTPGSTAAKPPATGFSFGGTPASTGGLFGAPATTGSLFGGSSTPAFGATGGSLFGSTPASTPATGTSLFGGTSTFGAAPTAGGGLFGAPQNPTPGSTTGAAGGFSFGPPAAQQQQQVLTPVQPAAVNQQPYGVLQPLPQVNVPEHKVGITQRPVRAAVTSMRPSPLLTLRTNTPKFGLGIPAAGAYSRPGSTNSASPYSLNPAASPAAADAAGGTPGGRNGSPAAALLLPVRDNPHRLFIRSPPPSTTPAGNGSSLSPAVGRAAAAAANAEDGTPVQTPPSRRATQQQQQEAAEVPRSNGTAKQAAAEEQHQQQAPPRAAAAAGSSKQPTPDAAAAGGDAPRLGALASEGYSIEPSERELQKLAQKNPDGLSRVSGFVIRRDGFGSLEWLEPVDVRGADLQDIVQIERGEVSLYMNADNTPSENKPPVGNGLNCRCRVTLTGVYKKSKQQQQSDGAAAAAAAAFRKRLQKYCSEMGAKFVDYRADGGVWIFEVDHFSRYGLPSDSDDDEIGQLDVDDMQECEATPGKKGGSQLSQEPEYTFGGNIGDDSDAEMVGNDVTQQPPSSRQQQRVRFSDQDMEHAADSDDEDRSQQQQQQQQDEEGAEEMIESMPLQHSLPALLGHSADQLIDLRQGLFFREGGAGATAVSADRAAAGALVSPMSYVDGRGDGDMLQRNKMQRRQLDAAPEHNWLRPRPALLQRQQQQGSDAAAWQQQLMLYGGDAGPAAAGAAESSPAAAAAAGAIVATPLTPRALQHYKRRKQDTAGPSSIAGAAAAAARIGSLLPSSVAINNSSNVVDASLMLGRSFRVGWGPNGVLAIPQNPGLTSSKTLDHKAAAAGSSSVALTDAKPSVPCSSRADDAGVPYVELRPLQPIAMVAEVNSIDESSSRSGIVSSAAAVAAMQQRVVSGLDVHLQYRSPDQQQQQQQGEEDAQMEEPDAAAAASPAPAAQWQLHLDRKQLRRFVAEQVHAIETAAKEAGDSSSNADSTAAAAAVASAAGCGQHIVDLWGLVSVLFEYIDGQDDSSSEADDGTALKSMDAIAAIAAANKESGSSSGQADGGVGNFTTSRLQLAAFQRKAALSRWLQRKLKPAVTAAVEALQSRHQQQQDVLLWSLLHFMTGRQIAAAVSVAVAVGDVRLATLLAAIGQNAAAVTGGANIVQQMQAWSRAALLPGHISTPRKLLFALMAAAAPAAAAGNGLLDVSAALDLDWSRAFGLWLWYGVPFTEPMAAVTRAFTAALAAAPQLPRPVPPHSSSSSGAQAATAAPADTQYALLQLHALGAHGLGVGLLNSYPDADAHVMQHQPQTVGGLVAQLLRAAGHSSNPLDYSTSWQLLMVLQSIGALPSRREEYEQVAVAISSNFISQLLLLGRDAPAAVCWAAFVALHIPDTRLSPGRRAAALQTLLEITAPHWCEEPQLVGWLRSELQLPLPWLHSAQASWFGYCHRYSLQLLHLIAAGNWQQAHDLACSKVAPLLVLAAGAAGAAGEMSAADAAVAEFVAAAKVFIEGLDAHVSEQAAAAAAAEVQEHASSSSNNWCNAAALQDEPAAAVAAAAYVAAACSQIDPGQQPQSAAKTAAVALRALCKALGAVRGTLGASWQLGGAVYAAWCAVFLDNVGSVHDPAAVAAGNDSAAPAGDLVESCLHLSSLLSHVAEATDGISSSSTAWWGSPLQRLVQARMTADVGKALIRLGASSSSGGQQQHASLVVPLAAMGYGDVFLTGSGLLGGVQSSTQMLAGAAATVAGSICAV